MSTVSASDFSSRINALTESLLNTPPTPPRLVAESSYFVPESSRAAWQADFVDISFGLARPHTAAALDTSGLAQDNGGESSSIAATAEYVQQSVIFEAALTMSVQANVSAKQAAHCLR